MFSQFTSAAEEARYPGSWTCSACPVLLTKRGEVHAGMCHACLMAMGGICPRCVGTGTDIEWAPAQRGIERLYVTCVECAGMGKVVA